MHTRTRPPDEPDVNVDGGIIEREVETVRTRQHVTGVAVDAIPASEAVVIEPSLSYFERERLNAVRLVVRTAIEALLGIRFLLHASGANPTSVFVRFVDGLSLPFAGPFANVFSNRSWGPGSIEVSTLMAMGVYFLIFSLLGMLATALAPRLSGVTMRRGMTTLWQATPSSSPAPPSAEDNDRRPPPVAAAGATRRHRRLFRRAPAREV